MARPRSFRRTLAARVTHVETALVGFYADTFARDQSAIVRGMIKNYVRADDSFDAKKFKKYVEEHVYPEAKNDPELLAEIREQMGRFLESVED